MAALQKTWETGTSSGDEVALLVERPGMEEVSKAAGERNNSPSRRGTLSVPLQQCNGHPG